MDDQIQDFVSRRERRKEQTYRRLLEASESLFQSKGFDATTVEEIAEAADVAKGTFFNYFESKDSLLSAILYARVYPLLISPPGAGAPVPERIRMLLEALWSELFPYRQFARRMVAHTIAQASPESAPRDYRLPSQTLAALIREGQAQGTFRAEANPDMMGGFIVTYFFRLFMFVCEKKDITEACWKDMIAENLELLYHGLVARVDLDT